MVKKQGNTFHFRAGEPNVELRGLPDLDVRRTEAFSKSSAKKPMTKIGFARPGAAKAKKVAKKATKKSAAKKASAKPGTAKSSVKKQVAAGPGTPNSATISAAKRIGVLDIDVYAGFLFRILAAINKSQKMFAFFPVEATTPVGLTASGERTREIVAKHGGNGSDPNISEDIFAPDVFAFVRRIAETPGIDVLVCLVRPMIMDLLTLKDDDVDSIGWNYFSTYDDNMILASSYGLREYALQANRPFEAALAIVILGQVISQHVPPADPSKEKELGFHFQTRACVMDYCEQREDLAKVLRKPAICPDCLGKIAASARKPVLAMLKAIEEYKR